MKPYFTLIFLLALCSCKLDKFDEEQMSISTDPTANFAIDSMTNNGYAPSLVFTKNSSLNASSYLWNFGDPTSGNNNTSTEEAPTHLYENPGIYTISLTTMNSVTNKEDFFEMDVTIQNVITFEKSIGTDNSSAYEIIELDQGGYAIVGHKYTSGSSYQVYLVVTDEHGDEIFNRTYGETNSDVGRSIVKTPEGGFAIGGFTNSYGSGQSDMYLILTDESGYELCEPGKTYGNTDSEGGYSIIATNNGYAFLGTAQKDSDGHHYFYLILTDNEGNELVSSRKYYGKNEYENHGYSICETQDGGFAMIGDTYNNNNGTNGGIYLILTDNNGNQLASSGKILGGIFSTSIIQTAEGGLAIGGTTSTPGNGHDFYLILTDRNGNILNEPGQIYGENEADQCLDIIQMNDGGFAMIGSSINSTTYETEIYLVLTDANGIEKTSSGKRFGAIGFNDTYNDTGSCIIQTKDGGLAIVGKVGNKAYFIKSDANGNL